MQFQVRCFDPAASAVRELVLDASSPEEVREHAKARGWVVLQLAATCVPKVRWRRSRSDFHIGWWCRELRTLLMAGMTVVEALEAMAATGSDAEPDRLLRALLVALQEGQSLSFAMQQSERFPAVLVASVKASERSSALIEALDDYLRYHDMLAQLRKQVVSASIYPGVVIGLGLLITAFLLLYVIPRFSRMYQDLSGPISAATSLIIWLSRTLHQHGQWLLVGAVATGLLTGFAWKSGALQRQARRMLAAVGPLQNQLDHFRLAKLYQSLALMFRGGYALDEALKVCATLRLGARLDAGLAQAQQRLMLGESVSMAFGAAGLSDPVAERLLRTGERTGGFDRVLQTIADRHAEAFSTFVERATRLVEPLLLMLVALVVGGIVVMMYMPVFDIASSLR